MTLNETTQVLIEKTRAGDRDAFDLLVKRFSPRLMAFIHSRMGQNVRSKLEAADVLQETFACVSESINKFKWQGEASFFSWLSNIAEHRIRNASRKKSWNHLVLDRDVTSSKTSPSKELRRNVRFDRLEHALESLEPDQRKAIRLARIDGLKVMDIAEKMGKSPDFVSKLLTLALLQLKRAFGDTDSLHLPQRTFKTEKEMEDE